MNESSEQHWERLGRYYSKQSVALALGAGLSVGCQIPGWHELLRRISTQCFGADGAAIYDRLLESGYALPAVASILEAERPSGHSFKELVRVALYQSFPFFPDGISKENHQKFIDYVWERNFTLRAVASLCTTRDTGSHKYLPNPCIRAIVNFNLDATLRAYMYRRYRTLLLRTVERASAGGRRGRSNVYHMHGFLEFKREHFGDPRKETDAVVLTEQEYFDFFNQPTGMFSSTFTYILREFHCVFIGMSLRDDNIRRLLHYSRAERVASHMREGKNRAYAEHRSRRHFAILLSSKNPTLNRLTETSLDRLGVAALWVDSFDEEITPRLQTLYETTGAKWTDVHALQRHVDASSSRKA